MIKESKMMMFETSPRAHIQEAQVESLERWYEFQMDLLDADFMEGGMTQAQYETAVRELKREFDEDYADIFGG